MPVRKSPASLRAPGRRSASKPPPELFAEPPAERASVVAKVPYDAMPNASTTPATPVSPPLSALHAAPGVLRKEPSPASGISRVDADHDPDFAREGRRTDPRGTGEVAPQATLKALAELFSRGASAMRCRNAVEDTMRRWREEIGSEDASTAAAELRDSLAEGVEQAEQGAAEFDGDPKERGAFTRTMNAQLAGMRAALTAAEAAAG